MNEEELNQLVDDTRLLTIREMRRKFLKMTEGLHDIGVGDVEFLLDRMERSEDES